MDNQPLFRRAAPTLMVADVGASIDYFVEALGFEKRFTNNDDGPVYAIVGRDAIEVHLARDKMADSAGKCSCCLFVTGIEAIFEELKSRGAKFERGLETAPYGLKEFLICDLDGNKILIGEPAGG